MRSLSKLSDVDEAPLKIQLKLLCTAAEAQALQRTKTEAYFYNLQLVCGSSSERSVELTVFFRNQSEAIRLRNPGDVVLINNGRIGLHEGERVLKLPLEGGNCGIAFYSGEGDGDQPYAKAGTVFDLTANLHNLRAVRDDSALWRLENRDFFKSGKEKRIEDLVPDDETFDLACNVVHHDLGHDPKVIWAWDGTDVVPEVLRGPDLLGNPILRKALSVSELVQPVKRNGEPLPEIGSFVPVLVIEEQRVVSLPKGWVKFRNLRCVRYQSAIMVLYTDETRWSPVPQIPSIHEYSLWRECYDQVAIHAMPANVVSRPVDRKMLHSTLRKVSRAIEEARESGRSDLEEFRCLVYLMDCDPDVRSIVDGFISGRGMSAELRLQDATGYIDAVLSDENGMRFLGVEKGDRPPEIVEELLNRALYGDEAVLWLDLCLRVDFGFGFEGSVSIFDTSIIYDH